jgi:hypothetical protein
VRNAECTEREERKEKSRIGPHAEGAKDAKAALV